MDFPKSQTCIATELFAQPMSRISPRLHWASAAAKPCSFCTAIPMAQTRSRPSATGLSAVSARTAVLPRQANKTSAPHRTKHLILTSTCYVKWPWTSCPTELFTAVNGNELPLPLTAKCASAKYTLHPPGPQKKLARRAIPLFDPSLTNLVLCQSRPGPSTYVAIDLFPHSYAAALGSPFRTRAAITTGLPPPAHSFTVFIRSGSA